MPRYLRWILGFAVLGGALVALGRWAPVQDAVVRRMTARRLVPPGRDLFAAGAMRVLLCGTSSPMPHPTRAKACTAVFAGGRVWVVDVGPGSWNRLARWQVDGARIGGVLLTHFHSDHVGELGEFNMQTWVAGRPAPLSVFGPPGVERVVAGFREAYALDTDYRVAHHGADLLPRDRSMLEARTIAVPDGPGAGAPVLDEDGVRITAFAVTHDPVRPAYGYRFDAGGRSVVVSGDTVKDAGLVAAARGADVLVHEAQAQHLVALIGDEAARAGQPRIAKIMSDIRTYHTSPVEAAEAANAAGVRLLVLTHLTPPPPVRLLEGVFVRGVDAVRPEGWVLADDGLLVTLPYRSVAVEVDALE